MGFVLIGIGLVMVVSGLLGTQGKLGSLLVGDLTGKDSFIYWLLAIMVVGSIGYIDKLRSFSDAFIALIILSMLLANRGVFGQFNSALSSGDASSPNLTAPTSTSSGSSSSSSSGSGTSGIFGTGISTGNSTADSVVGDVALAAAL